MKSKARPKNASSNPKHASTPQHVDSLLDVMKPGREFESIVSTRLNLQMVPKEIWRAIGEVEAVRRKPLLCYVANTINQRPGADTSISTRDEVPFFDMVDSAAPNTDVDLLLVTPGGSAQTVASAVAAMRRKYRNVTAILPFHTFSAGTLWALASNNIIMDERAVLGPIDPQVQMADGRFVPFQTLLILLNKIGQELESARKNGAQLPIVWLDLLRTMDKKEIGFAISSSSYMQKIASDWLRSYKFRDWTHRKTTGASVTDAYKAERADEIASLLSSHGRWLSHGHRISRDDAKKELRLQIEDLEMDMNLFGAVRRLWALFAWIFEKTGVGKFMASNSAYLWMLQQGR